jgi:fucose 4-O-acetylase-like acetyltransferase
MGGFPDGPTACAAFSVVPMMVMIVTALAAAVCYGTGAAVQQRQAVAAPRSLAGRPGLLVRLAQQPLWLAGFAVQVVGFAAHALALRTGPLTAVQMVMSADLVVAVIMIRVWSGRPLSRASWVAALTVVGGIVLFIALTARGYGQGGRAGHALAAPLAAAVPGSAALVAAAAGLRASGRGRAVLLALAAGLADTCSAVVTMTFAHVVSHGPVALFSSWSVYALVVCGVSNVLLTQTAYQAGRPLVTLPVIAAVTPAASVAVGIGLLGETFRTGPAGVAAIGVAVVMTVIALAWLACAQPGRVTPSTLSSSASSASAASISARWVKACGKLPSCSPVGPISSENRPTWLE